MNSTHEPSANWTERATERENDEVLDRLAESTFGELEKLRHALDRLDEGKYGICEDCGKPIGPERMRSIPYATFCLTCLDREKPI